MQAIFLLSSFILFAICAPAGADHVITTSTKVFFEKNGVPYNDPVFFTVTCYGFTYTYADPESKKYLSGDYEKRPPGSDNQTEVFSYSATVDHYGDEIFEPFYLNYRVIDYCSLCGETGGKKFYIADAGETPISNCTRERYYPVDYEPGSDVCYLPTEQYLECDSEEFSLRNNLSFLCNKYLEEFDEDVEYPDDVRFRRIGGEKMVVTEDYTACRKAAGVSADLNCSRFLDEIPCEGIVDPEGNPIRRDCSLYFEIPADKEGNIIEYVPEPDETYTPGIEDRSLSGGGFDLISLIYEFFRSRGY